MKEIILIDSQGRMVNFFNGKKIYVFQLLLLPDDILKLILLSIDDPKDSYHIILSCKKIYGLLKKTINGKQIKTILRLRYTNSILKYLNINEKEFTYLHSLKYKTIRYEIELKAPDDNDDDLYFVRSIMKIENIYKKNTNPLLKNIYDYGELDDLVFSFNFEYDDEYIMRNTLLRLYLTPESDDRNKLLENLKKLIKEPIPKRILHYLDNLEIKFKLKNKL
jgi:hypothetical protein